MVSDVAGGRSRPGLDRALLVVLLVLSLGCVVRDYRIYLEDSRPHWTSFYHDRHAHCAYAMDMAEALRSWDVVGLANVLQRNIVWPPVHGLVSAVAMLTVGFDHRAAVFPAVLGWWLLLVFGPLAARGSVPHFAGGWLAAAFTWIMLAQSPAYRSYSTECLLEGLGAGLTALCLYLYVSARQQPDQRKSWLALAVGLCVLFFEKSNYWLIVVAGLLVAETLGLLIGNNGRRWLWEACQSGGRVIAGEMRRPLTWLGLLLIGVSVAIALRGPTYLTVFGQSISLYPPGTLVLLAYVCLFIRGVSVVRERGWTREEVVGPAISAMMHGLVAPIAISFLIPKRLLLNLWFLSPINAGEQAARPVWEAIEIYWRTVREDYHTQPWLAILAVILLALCLLLGRRLRAAGWGIMAVVVVATVLLLMHPNQKARFLHSWLATIWIVGGMGLGAFWELPLPRWVQRLTAAACVGMALLGLIRSPAALPMMVDQQPGPSLLNLSDWYLDATKSADKVAILSTQPDINFFGWTCRERFGTSGGLEKDAWLWWPIETPAALREGFGSWLARTKASDVVVVDVPPSSPQYRAVQHRYSIYGDLPKLMEQQPTFQKVASRTIDGCQATIWRRVPMVSRERLDTSKQ